MLKVKLENFSQVTLADKKIILPLLLANDVFFCDYSFANQEAFYFSFDRLGQREKFLGGKNSARLAKYYDSAPDGLYPRALR